VLDRLEGSLRKPLIELLESLLAREDLIPDDLPLSGVGLGDGGIKDPHRSGPDIDSGAIPFNERNHRIVGNIKFATLNGDSLTIRGRGNSIEYGHKDSFYSF